MKNNHEENKEKEKPEGEILDFNKPTFEFIPKGSHEWRQRGNYLICKSCDLEHATFIGMNVLMVGTDKSGQPILVNRKDYATEWPAHLKK